MDEKPSTATDPPGTADVNERWAVVDGHRMRYLQAGGPGAFPLLLIHGLLGYSFSWRLNLASLAQHAGVYAVDLLGVGYSERPCGLDCSLRASAERMWRFLDTVGLERADVLGTSHGGGLAMMMAATAPQRVRKLVLAAPVNPWSSHGRWMIRFLSTPLGGAMFRRAAPALRGQEYFLRRMYGDPRRIPPGTLEGYDEPLFIPGTWEYLLAVLKCWESDLAQLAAMLERIAEIPTLLMWGTRDGAVLPHSALELQKRLRRAELLMMQGVGHLPYEESPEEFNRAVRRFLEVR